MAFENLSVSLVCVCVVSAAAAQKSASKCVTQRLSWCLGLWWLWNLANDIAVYQIPQAAT